MKISDKRYYPVYQKEVEAKLSKDYAAYDFSEASSSFEYQTTVSAVFSSNIEGNSIDLNSFINLQFAKEKFKPTKEVQEIENLIKAYNFAQNNPLTEKNLLQVHKILSETLLIKGKRGKYRDERTGVFSKSGLVYLAVEPELVSKEMDTFFREIAQLLSMRLSLTETFYFASLIHLRFVHIHPFADGNGRAARLLEKWFMSAYLGNNAWKIPSERYYKEHQAQYYDNINLGVNFYELDYDRSLSFLYMLPQALVK